MSKTIKKIYLSGQHSDKFVILDSDDYERLHKYKWHSVDGYAVRYYHDGTKYTLMCMHREIMGLKSGSPEVVDHINHNVLDNRKENLRICTLSQNSCNRKPNSNKSHPYKGLIFCPKYARKWKVIVRVKDLVIEGGRFDDIVMAAKRADQLARQYHGEFAYLNFPTITDYSDVEAYLKKNQIPPKKDPSLPAGIVYRHNKFIARISIRGKYVNLGRFDTKDEAIQARKVAEQAKNEH